MKTSAIKTIKSLFNLLSVNNLKKKFNKSPIITGIVLIILIILVFYFIRPYFLNFNSEKEFIENKINREFKINGKIKGNINYNFFPSPRIKIKNIEIKFNQRSEKISKIDNSYIILSPLSLTSIKNFKFNNFLVSEQKVKVYPKDIKNYLIYFLMKKNKNILIKNSEIFFQNDQNDIVAFEDFNLNQKVQKTKNKIDINTIFSQNRVKIKFLDNYNEKKYFTASIPTLESSVDIIFNKDSNIENLSGQLKLDLFKSILLINFEGSKNFKILNSFFRNKFLNSKINGKISFDNGFYFDLDTEINKINLRQLLFYYFSSSGDQSQIISGLSKKLNGKIKINNKSSNSFLGRLNNSKATLIFESGKLKIENGSTTFFDGTKLNFNGLYGDSQGFPKLNFTLSFSTENAKKFLKKFDLHDYSENNLEFIVKGFINLQDKKLKISNIIKNNNERISRGVIMKIEKKFNTFVIKDSNLDLLDFFKLKKFAKETFFLE